MQTYFKMMHSTAARLVRVFGGIWLVVSGSELSVLYALTLAIVGAAIAVTGIADICPMELIVNRGQVKGQGSHQRVG